MECAAVDLGSISGRVIVRKWNGGKLELKEIHRFANNFRSLVGHDYWDMPAIWKEILAGLAEAKRLHPRPASVEFDGWAVDHVLVGPLGRQVFPMHAYIATSGLRRHRKGSPAVA